MVSKIAIILACSLAIVSVADAGAKKPAKSSIKPTPCDNAKSSTDLSNACSSTVSSCQSGLGNVSGPGAGTALGLSTSLSLVLGPLLAAVVALVSSLLSSVLDLVTKLLAAVLALLCAVINLVIDLLNGLLGQSDYQDQCNTAYNDACTKVKSCGGTGGLDDSLIQVVLKLVATILSLVINIKL